MPYELTVQSELKADHLLAEREEVHPHRWRIRACVSGELENGRVVSLPLMKALLDEILIPLQESFLNENSSLDEVSRCQPTCENMSRYFFEKLHTTLAHSRIHPSKTIELKWVEVNVLESDGLELGGARFFKH